MWLVVPPLVRQLSTFASDIPDYIDRFDRLRVSYASLREDYPGLGSFNDEVRALADRAGSLVGNRLVNLPLRTAELLFDAIAGTTPRAVSERVACELVVRESCGAPGVGIDGALDERRPMRLKERLQFRGEQRDGALHDELVRFESPGVRAPAAREDQRQREHSRPLHA